MKQIKDKSSFINKLEKSKNEELRKKE